MSAAAADEIRSRQIRDWLLAFLRFVVTRDEADRDAFLARAREMDRGGSYFETKAFAFFTRTSTELCASIPNKDDPQSRARLERLLRRISDSRLRDTLETAMSLEPGPGKRETRARSREYLWEGLAPRS